MTVRGNHQNILITPKTLSPTSIAYILWLKERPRSYKRITEETKNPHLPLLHSAMSSPLASVTPSPTITTAELTAIEIIKEAITNHLNLRTPPPSPQPTMPLPTFPLTIAIPSPLDLVVHIDDRDPSPFALCQPLPNDTLDSPIDYKREANKENDDPNDPGLPFFPNNPTST